MWECYTCSGPVFWCEFNGDVRFVIGVTIYGNTGKCGSVIHVLDQFFDVNSMVMSILWSEWPYMAMLANAWVLYMFWTSFLMWIQWWCLFHDWSDHIWHSDHERDTTIEFASKTQSRTYITLPHFPVLPYMVTPITKRTSPLNSHQKTGPEHV